MRDRCDGSLATPTETTVEYRDRSSWGGRPVTLGVCPSCGAWCGLTTSRQTQQLRPHIDYRKRGARGRAKFQAQGI